jgi:hypothetical protein
MAFKLSGGLPPAPNTPEQLFADLRPRKIEHLHAHQADILRTYHSTALDEPDAVLQLPTGSGKTLVGLLIAEWRRQRRGERAVFLCPTKQLVHQVVEQAKTHYGINALPFVGRKDNYSPAAKAAYEASEAIAVTAFSGLFNVNPFFVDPHVIVLDDAHAAEQYVANMWTVRIGRYDEHKSLFQHMVAILKPTLGSGDYARLATETPSDWDPFWVDKIPTPTLFPLLPDIQQLFDGYVQDSDLKFPWSRIRNNLKSCNLYVGTHEIMIRPWLAPTDTHAPFANAKQRLYMSATPGDSGELERIFARPKLKLVPPPAGWDRQGVGRRFFLFPVRSLIDDDVKALELTLINQAGRALIMVPDGRREEAYEKNIKDHLKHSIFHAKDIEASKSGFISSPDAVAIVANRYDGIDFPGDSCRLEIIDGVPRASNLQEQFLITKMGATVMLNERIMTRLSQAFGRCTRSATDYAAVFITGDQLGSILARQDNLALLHPEIQAELKFGWSQSEGLSKEDFVANFTDFLAQDKSWQAANAEIVKTREGLAQVRPPCAMALRESAQLEIRYMRAIWRHDFQDALDAAQSILGKLDAPELRGYRALWHYFAGSAAWLASADGGANLLARSAEHFNRAKYETIGINWLAVLARRINPTLEITSGNTEARDSVVERLESNLERLGISHNHKFDQEAGFILENIDQNEASLFEQAHERLGRLIGYETGNPNSTASPDPWWIANEDLCFVFEDYSDAKQGAVLGANKATQAARHPEWCRENLRLSKSATVLPVLIANVEKADKDAIPHMVGLAHWSLDEFRIWARRSVAVVRELRGSFSTPGDLVWRAQAATMFDEPRWPVKFPHPWPLQIPPPR